ncbi:MAG: hypothetical protein ACRDP1_15205 [Nocardioidaceae bacterium]
MPDDGLIQVGHGVATLAVPEGTALGGYADRDHGSVGTLDPLEVHAVVVRRGDTTAVVCVADLLAVNTDLVAHTRTVVAGLVGAPPRLVWLTATHTHAGPDATCRPRGGATPGGWLELVGEAVVVAVEQADRTVTPASLSLHKGSLDDVGGQRSGAQRGLTAPAGVVSVRRPGGGELVGVLAFVGVHSTVLDATNTAVSADLPGGIRRALTRDVDAWCVVGTGAAGDISTRPHRRAQTPAEVDRLGSLSAQQLLALADQPPVADGDPSRPLRGAAGEALLAPKPGPAPAEAASAEARAHAAYQRATRHSSDRVGLRDAYTTWQATRIAAQTTADGSDVPCAVARLDLSGIELVGLGGEPFSALERVTGPHQLLVGYANGYAGYLPIAAAYQRQEYEVLMSPVAPGESERLTKLAATLELS